jgi:hypothetical protein
MRETQKESNDNLNKSGATGRTYSSGGTKMRKVVDLYDNLRLKSAVEIVKVI